MEIFKLVKYIFVGSLPSVRNENINWGKFPPPLSLLQVAYDRTQRSRILGRGNVQGIDSELVLQGCVWMWKYAQGIVIGGEQVLCNLNTWIRPCINRTLYIHIHINIFYISDLVRFIKLTFRAFILQCIPFSHSLVYTILPFFYSYTSAQSSQQGTSCQSFTSDFLKLLLFC